jgi:hypothetical protein
MGENVVAPSRGACLLLDFGTRATYGIVHGDGEREPDFGTVAGEDHHADVEHLLRVGPAPAGTQSTRDAGGPAVADSRGVEQLRSSRDGMATVIVAWFARPPQSASPWSVGSERVIDAMSGVR